MISPPFPSPTPTVLRASLLLSSIVLPALFLIGCEAKTASKDSKGVPASYRVKLSTTKGDIVIEVTREWSPNGADRFYRLVNEGFFTDVAFFRVIDGFMAQFGISGDPKVSERWRDAGIPDDVVRRPNLRGYVTFAKSNMPASRTTQLFINLADNVNLDSSGFSPIGKVAEGMEVVDSLYKGYGEGAPGGAGPNQMLLQMKGNAYLRESFPKLDYVKSAAILP